jgi:hypothetical protein
MFSDSFLWKDFFILLIYDFPFRLPPLRIRKLYISRSVEEENRLALSKAVDGLWNRNVSLYNSLWTALWLFWIIETTILQMAVLRDVPAVHNLAKAFFTVRRSRRFHGTRVCGNEVTCRNEVRTFLSWFLWCLETLSCAALCTDRLGRTAPKIVCWSTGANFTKNYVLIAWGELHQKLCVDLLGRTAPKIMCWSPGANCTQNYVFISWVELHPKLCVDLLGRTAPKIMCWSPLRNCTQNPSVTLEIWTRNLVTFNGWSMTFVSRIFTTFRNTQIFVAIFFA